MVDDVRLIRCTETEVLVLFQNRLTRISDLGKTVSRMDSTDAHSTVAAELFDLPNAPIEQALQAVAVAS